MGWLPALPQPETAGEIIRVMPISFNYFFNAYIIKSISIILVNSWIRYIGRSIALLTEFNLKTAADWLYR